MASDLGLQQVCVASDCLEVINSLGKPCLGAFSTVLEEIKWRATSFDKAFFVHGKRSSNREAHSLACYSSSLDPGRRVWFVEPPDGLCIPMSFNN